MLDAIGIIVVLITFVTGIYLILKGVDDESFIKQFIGFALIIFAPFVGVGAYCALKNNSDSKSNIPQAIDVYRGKTTLEITYRDSIPVDSIVVFKDK